MIKYYDVFNGGEKVGSFRKRDLVDLHINASTRGLSRIEQQFFSGKEVLTLVYEDGNTRVYVREGFSSQFFEIDFI